MTFLSKVAAFFNSQANAKEKDTNVDTPITSKRNSSEALKFIMNNQAAIGPGRHKIAQSVIKKYSSSNNPEDQLAVGIAYEWEGAKYRQEAINYYEMFLASGIKTKLIGDWFIYSSLSKLYEKEYLFDKAIDALYKCIEANKGGNSADYTRIGDIYIKMNIDKASSYYEDLKKTKSYLRHKREIDLAIVELEDKIKRGYVYRSKPRIKNTTLDS